MSRAAGFVLLFPVATKTHGLVGYCLVSFPTTANALPSVPGMAELDRPGNPAPALTPVKMACPGSCLVGTVEEDMACVLKATSAGAVSRFHSLKWVKITSQRNIPRLHLNED